MSHGRAEGWSAQAHVLSKKQKRKEPSWYCLDLQRLCTASLVSRRLRDVAQPILYHEFSPGYGDSWLSRQCTWSGRLFSFLRTLTRRPDLAKLVQGLHLDYRLLTSIAHKQNEIEAALEDLALIRGIDLPTSLEQFRSIREQELMRPPRPSADELVAMVLSCLPSLARLYIPYSIALNPPPTSALSAAGSLRLPLQTLEIDADGTNLRNGLGGILDMSISTLRTLDVDFFTSSDDEKPGFLNFFFPSLRNINVTSSRMDGLDVKLLLSRCTGLEKFSYNCASSTGCIRPSHIIASLSKHKETLTTMRLGLQES
ncbi:hypothetical protein F5Y16DRAFT_214489 [Xylariaceae sp. FL0255]|nr:hypothetical protein F5Y16DRAFT_214489 [Xylariaceae sp. FL0255]